MKPDANNPGSIESATRNVDSVNVAKNKTEISYPVQAEAQPQAVSSSPVSSAAATNTQRQTSQTSATDDSGQDDSNANHFESQIAQLPAEDAEVIEKEWVDKVDEIVDKTASDPYFEDQAHHSLSKAYLKRRFNLDIE